MLWATLLPLLGANFLTHAQQSSGNHSLASEPLEHSVSGKKIVEPHAYPALITAPRNEEVGNCSARPLGLGAWVYPDTAKDFRFFSGFHTLATVSAVPANFSLVFTEATGPILQGQLDYLESHDLSDYFPQLCANWCDKTKYCQAFNIFFERTPTVHLGPDCRTSRSSTTVRCVL